MPYMKVKLIKKFGISKAKVNFLLLKCHLLL